MNYLTRNNNVFFSCRYAKSAVGLLTVFLLVDFLVYRLARTDDVYVTVPGHPRVRLIPRQFLTVRDVPILRHFVDEEQNDECGNVVLSRKPQLLFNHWQVYKKKDLPMISAWGAFLDTRTESQKALVRIFAVSEQHTGQAVFCQFWANQSNANELHLVITEADYKVIGRGLQKRANQVFRIPLQLPIAWKWSAPALCFFGSLKDVGIQQ